MKAGKSAFSRRKFVVGALATGGIGVALARSRLPSVARPTVRRLLASNDLTRRLLNLAYASYDEWASLVGLNFTVSGAYVVRLAGVRPLNSQGERPPEVIRRSAFSLEFDIISGGAMVGDLIYYVRHAEYGAAPLFLSNTPTASRVVAILN